MSFIEKQAKTVDLAIEAALAELGVTADEALIEVLDEGESGGLLGFGRRPACVRVSVSEGEAPEIPKLPDEEIDQDFELPDFTDYAALAPSEEGGRTERRAERRERSGQGARGQRSEQKKPSERRRGSRSQGQRDERSSQRRERELDRPRQSVEKQERREPKPRAELNESEKKEMEERCFDFLAGILRGLEIHGTMASFYDDEGCLHVEVDGDELGHAIGRGGENLEAIQYLTTLAMNKGREDYFRIMLDIGKYREKNYRILRQRAEDAAYRVLDSGRQQSLPPMQASDRRVVHLVVAGIEGVYSISQGAEPRRRVVIRRANER